MKRVLIMLSLVFMGFAVTSCYDDSSLWNSINDHEQRIDDLETKVKEANSNIDAISALLSASSTGDPIVSVDPLKEGDVEVGYLLTFASGKTVTIYHGQDGQDGQDGKDGTDGKDGADGKDGQVPQISIAAEDGVYYWTVNGEWLLDAEGNKIPATGASAMTPQLKIENDLWYVSYDGGITWEKMPVIIEGDQDVTSSIGSVTYDEEYVYINLAGGETIIVARTSGLDLIFPEGAEFKFYPGESFSIKYQIIGGDDKTQVVALAGNGWKATVESIDAATGYVHIESPTVHDDGEVVLLVSDGKEKSFIKTITFNEGVLFVVNDSFEVDSDAATVNVTLNTDLNYYIVTYADWISLPDMTKSDLREETVTLQIAENESVYARGEMVYFVNNNGWIINSVYIYQYGKPYEAWYLVGGFNGWMAGDENYMMNREGDWFVLKGFETVDTPLKFNPGTWDDQRSGKFVAADFANLLNDYSDNMTVPAGKYDVYMDKNATRAYFMTPGNTPGDLSETKPFEAGDYWLSAENMLATPLDITLSSGYLYMTGFDYTENGLLTSSIKNVFTFTETEGGFTIQDNYGRYLYQTAGATNFKVSYGLPESGYIWDVAYMDDGTVKIYNQDVDQFVQYSLTYASFGSYPTYESDRLMPYLLPAISPIKEVQEITVYNFLAAAEDQSWYKMTGKVANLKNTKYGNFDLVDATGSVYVYGLTATRTDSNDQSFSSLGIEEGDIVTIIGQRASYKGVPQVGGPAYYVSHEGHVEATVADFLYADEGDTWYKLTGVVSNMASTIYGNFDLVDETGSVYVYGVTAAPVLKNDKSFASLDIAEGDTLTIIGKRTSYKGEPQVGGPAYYISHKKPVVDDIPSEEIGPYASNVVFTTLSSAYIDGIATVNGVENVATLKFGTSKKYGEALITLPAGTTKVSYYAVAWKGYPSKLEFSVGGEIIGTQEVAANDGATGSSPYTITVSDSDLYTFELPSALDVDTDVTVKTVETGFRAIIFGVVAE